MSGAAQQLRHAETSAPAAPSLDWDSLEGFVSSEDGKRELAALRTAYFSMQEKAAGDKQVAPQLHTEVKPLEE